MYISLYFCSLNPYLVFASDDLLYQGTCCRNNFNLSIVHEFV